MSPANTQTVHRCMALGSLLCMAVAPGPVRAAETLRAPIALTIDIQRSMRASDPPAAGNAAALIQMTVDRQRHGSSAGYRWVASSASGTDWNGIERDTWYFLGYQFATIGVLYVAPESVSGWSEEQKNDYSFTRWKDNVRNPRWDKDQWWINYLLHPYWGGTYYVRAQERGLDRRQSFLYSVLLSTLFEFGAEALFEAPSYQDLVVTPLGGYLVGRYLFAPIRERIHAQPGEPGWGTKTVLFLTDPLGAANAKMDAVFGLKENVSLQLVAPGIANEARPVRGQTEYQHGNSSERSTFQGWGLQIRVAW